MPYSLLQPVAGCGNVLVVARFDAELYLRLAGERLLLNGQPNRRGPRGGSPLNDVAETLVSIGAIPTEAAEVVLQDYELAEALRQPGRLNHLMVMSQMAPSARAESRPFGPWRVATCGRTLEQPWGRLRIHYIVLSDEETTLTATLESNQPVGRRPMLPFHRPTSPWGGTGPPQLTLTDDRGTTSTAGFSGGGSDKTWQGRFRTDRPLARDTAWIEVLGERVELGSGVRPAEVRVEPTPEQSPAIRHLWHRVAGLGSFPGPPDTLEPVIETLVAAEALAADDQVIEDARRVAAMLTPQAGPVAPSSRPLPQPWQTLVAGLGRTNGPKGSVVVGTATPPIDGCCVAVMRLESASDSFTVEVRVRGSAARLPGHHQAGGWIEWWAADDLGNPHLGHLNAGGSAEELEGEVAFWPPLDPRATQLDLIPTTSTTRAVMAIPLNWDLSS
jgi:hypothetical protein